MRDLKSNRLTSPHRRAPSIKAPMRTTITGAIMSSRVGKQGGLRCGTAQIYALFSLLPRLGFLRLRKSHWIPYPARTLLLRLMHTALQTPPLLPRLRLLRVALLQICFLPRLCRHRLLFLTCKRTQASLPCSAKLVQLRAWRSILACPVIALWQGMSGPLCQDQARPINRECTCQRLASNYDVIATCCHTIWRVHSFLSPFVGGRKRACYFYFDIGAWALCAYTTSLPLTQ